MIPFENIPDIGGAVSVYRLRCALLGSAIRTPAVALSRACRPTVRTILVISLATHVLRQTGCCEQTRYAMQDMPEVVQQHYGLFLPQDKTMLAAKILKPGLRGRVGKEKGAV